MRRLRTASIKGWADIFLFVVEKLFVRCCWCCCDDDARKGKEDFKYGKPPKVRVEPRDLALNRRKRDAMSWMENARNMEARKSQRGICIWRIHTYVLAPPDEDSGI